MQLVFSSECYRSSAGFSFDDVDGNGVIWRLGLFAHSKKESPGRSLHARALWLPPKVQKHAWVDSKLGVGVNVGVSGRLSLCVRPVTNRQPVQDAPCGKWKKVDG